MDRVVGIIAANFVTDEMGELSSERTIASVPFGGKYRLVDFALSNLVNSGISTIGLITPYKYRSIIDHVGAGKPWNLDRKSGGLFVLPGSVFGVRSSHSRFLIRDLIRNQVFLMRSPAPYVVITAANVISHMDFYPIIKQHIDTGADITLVHHTFDRQDSMRYGLKIENGRVVGLKTDIKEGDEAFVDTFVITRDLLLKILEWYSAIDYLDFFEAIEGDFDVRAYKYDGYIRGVLTAGEYYKFSMELLKPAVSEELFSAERAIISKPQESAPAKYLEGAKVKNSMITSGCLIEGEVEHSILFRGVKVGRGAVVKNCIVMQRCTIEPGAHVENVILDKSNVIRAGTVITGSGEETFIMEKNL